MDLIKKLFVVATTMLVLDGIWLGLVAPRFYFENLKHLVRINAAGTGIDVLKGPAAIVYVIMIVAFMLFLAPIVVSSSWGDVLLKSALFGLAIYGVYDFTNMATLRDWPLVLSLCDMAWGAVLFTITATVFKLAQGWGFFTA